MPTAIEQGAFDCSAVAETPIKHARLRKPNNQGQIRVQGIDVRVPAVAKVTSFLEGIGGASCVQSRWRQGILCCCVQSARCGSSTRRMDAQCSCLTGQCIQVSASSHGHQRLGDESAMSRGIEASRAGKGSQVGSFWVRRVDAIGDCAGGSRLLLAPGAPHAASLPGTLDPHAVSWHRGNREHRNGRPHEDVCPSWPRTH